MTYQQLIYEVLKKAHFSLSVKEIWDNACKMGLDKQLQSIGKTPIATIEARMYVNIKTNQNSKFIFASKRPTTFWLKERQNELNSKPKRIKEFINESTHIVSFCLKKIFSLLKVTLFINLLFFIKKILKFRFFFFVIFRYMIKVSNKKRSFQC